MRRIAALFLVVLLIATQTPLGQLLKLPVLIEHFYKHKKQDSISLLQFLNAHYATEHNDADRSEDQRLPFKAVLLQNIGSAIVPSPVKVDFALPQTTETKIILRDVYLPQQHLSSIFHPPRV